MIQYQSPKNRIVGSEAGEQRLPERRPGRRLRRDHDALLLQQRVERLRVGEVRHPGRELGRRLHVLVARRVADRVLERPLDRGVLRGDRRDVAGLHLREEGRRVRDRHPLPRGGAEEQQDERPVDRQQQQEGADLAPADPRLLVGLRGSRWSRTGSSEAPPSLWIGASVRPLDANRLPTAGPWLPASPAAELHPRVRACETRPRRQAAYAGAARNPASRPVRGSRGRDARGRGRLEASSAAGDARAPAGPGGRRRRARRRPVGGGAPGRSAERAPSPHRSPPRGARRGVDRRLSRRVRAEGRACGRGPVRGAARGDALRAAGRRRPCRGGRGRVGAGPLARTGAAGSDRHGVVQRRGAPARDAARRRARGGLRGQARARRASRARRRRFGRRSRTTPSGSGCGGS